MFMGEACSSGNQTSLSIAGKSVSIRWEGEHREVPHSKHVPWGNINSLSLMTIIESL